MCEEMKTTRYLPGLLGALVGALIGGVVWVLLYHFGYLAGIAGWLIVFCAFKGFQLLGKKLNTGAIVLCLIISVLTAAAACALGMAWDITDAFNELEAGSVTLVQVLENFPDIMTYFELWGDFFKDLAVGLVLGIIAAWSCVRQAFKDRKAADEVEE